jgi:hypothetical protein
LEINKSVLDLITTYPELASLMENKGGVLTIDMEGEGVQKALDDAQTRVFATQA